jgi:WD40 repeat protein
MNYHVMSVAFDSNDMLASGSDYNRSINLWNKYTGELIRTLESLDDYGVMSVAFDTNNMLAGGHVSDTIHLWNKNTGELLRTLNNDGND